MSQQPTAEAVKAFADIPQLMTGPEAEAAMKALQNLTAEELNYHLRGPHADTASVFKPALVPDYEPGHYGEWELVHVPVAMHRAYFNGVRPTPNAHVLKRNGAVWMSITAMEIESQMPHFHVAKGIVVNYGLGMGFSALNFAANPEVTEVHIVERDPEVVELFYATSGYDMWPDEYRDKITMHVQDAFAEVEGVPYADFVYVDTWLCMNEPGMVPDTHRIVDTFDEVKQVGMWTQECDLITWYAQTGAHGEQLKDIGPEHFEQWAHERGLPLFGAELTAYHPWMVNVAQNMLCY